jgi:hypothetical protein
MGNRLVHQAPCPATPPPPCLREASYSYSALRRAPAERAGPNHRPDSHAPRGPTPGVLGQLAGEQKGLGVGLRWSCPFLGQRSTPPPGTLTKYRC